MPWHAQVTVTTEIHESSFYTLGICRLVGIFPAAVEKDGSKWIYKWSGIYACLSYILGIILLSTTYTGFLQDAMAGKEKSIRIKSSTDMYIVFFDITVVELVVFFGIFITPFRFKTFCTYIETVVEADVILAPNDSKRARKVSAVVLVIVLVTTTIVLVADLLVYFRIDGERITRRDIVESYLAFYVTHYIMLVTQYQLWYMGYIILRRLTRLNELLRKEAMAGMREEKEVLEVKPFLVSDFFPHAKNVEYPSRKADNNENNTQSSEPQNENDNERILKLTRAYLRLCDAVEIQNHLLGFVSAVLITGILLQLILSTYGLFVELAGSRRDPFFTLMKAIWCVVHLVRLFMIVEPSHACTVESQNTKDLVCKLLCSNISDEMKVQLDAFAMALFHRKVEFYASGLATVDRSLVTSVIGAITTYLVILLQFIKPE